MSKVARYADVKHPTLRIIQQLHRRNHLKIQTGRAPYNHQRFSVFTPIQSMVGQFEVSYSAFSAILLHIGVPVGVVYTGNNVILRS